MTLHWRLFASFLAVLVFSLAVAGLSLSALWSNLQDRLTVGRLTDVAIPLYAQAALRFKQGEPPEQVMGFLDDQSTALDVDVLVLSADGSIFQATGGARALVGMRLPLPANTTLPSASGTTLRAQASGSFRDGDGRFWQFVILPFAANPRLTGLDRGWFVVAQDESRMPSAWTGVLPRILIAGGLGLVSALLLAVALARWLTRPLQRLAWGLDAAAAGDYSRRVTESGPSETVSLARRFNRMAADLERSQALMRGFVATLSHELRTPLTAIRGFQQALLDGSLAAKDEREHAIRLMQKETQRLQRLVAELLDLSRLQAQQVRLKRERLDLGDLVRQVEEILGPRAEENGVLLADEVPGGLLVLADADRVEQVLTNLIDNALRHTPAGGSVTVSSQRRALGAGPGSSILEIAVHNTGSYIAPEVIPYLFEPFYQGPGTRPGGAGLGLAIAREIATAHGGDLRAESHPSFGTTFTLALPAEPLALDAAPTAAATPRKRRRSPDPAVTHL